MYIYYSNKTHFEIFYYMVQEAKEANNPTVSGLGNLKLKQ